MYTPSSRTVLVVNDDADTAQFLSLLLEQSGFVATIAVDGADGLDKARQYAPDVVVCDVMMPRMDGLAFCRAVRADDVLRETPVLLVTALSKGTDTMVQAMTAGADDFLESPYDPVRLVAKVTRLVERRQAERESSKRMRALCAALADLVIVLDRDGRFHSIEQTKRGVLYRPAAEMIGRTLHDVMPEYADRFLREIHQALGSGQPHDVEYWLDVEGGTKWFEATISPLSDDMVFWVARDVTQLRRSMADLQAISARLNDAREQERVKMARDIHDNFGQALTALKMDVAEIRRRLDAGDSAVIRERLTEMSALIDISVDDVRRVAGELRPVVLDDLGFVGAIRAYLIDVERRAAIRCVLSTPSGDLPIAGDRATALFRILQEALTNVVRHAEATRVDVSLTVHGGRVRLVVHDNGRGVPAEAVSNPRSLGLLGMRDRAVLIGGDVSVTGGPGAGTTVTVELPIEGTSR